MRRAKATGTDSRPCLWRLRWWRRLLAPTLGALLVAGCGTTQVSQVAAGSQHASHTGSTQLAVSHTATKHAARSNPSQPSESTRCPADMTFPLCPLPLPGFPQAQQQITLGYQNTRVRPQPTLEMQTLTATIHEIPSHVLHIEYGVEHHEYSRAPCDDSTANTTTEPVRGDTHATVCVESGFSVILAALWTEMGTSWRATLSSNNTKPYSTAAFVQILDAWTTTGYRPLARFR
jgi:hypothetical protein